MTMLPLLILLLVLLSASPTSSSKQPKLSTSSLPQNPQSSRPIIDIAKSSFLCGLGLAVSNPQLAQAASTALNSLDNKEAERSIFNLPPRAIEFPAQFLGIWTTAMKFEGAVFTDQLQFNDFAKNPDGKKLFEIGIILFRNGILSLILHFPAAFPAACHLPCSLHRSLPCSLSSSLTDSLPDSFGIMSYARLRFA
jgi:hypothetical protein